jgi:hypothetical protein
MNTAKLSDETHEVRITSLTVLPRGMKLYHAASTTISIESTESLTGEIVVIKQDEDNGSDGASITITPDEWLVIRGAIDKMIEECRDHE